MQRGGGGGGGGGAWQELQSNILKEGQRRWIIAEPELLSFYTSKNVTGDIGQ